jgi:hypothetical protein
MLTLNQQVVNGLDLSCSSGKPSYYSTRSALVASIVEIESVFHRLGVKANGWRTAYMCQLEKKKRPPCCTDRARGL